MRTPTRVEVNISGAVFKHGNTRGIVSDTKTDRPVVVAVAVVAVVVVVIAVAIAVAFDAHLTLTMKVSMSNDVEEFKNRPKTLNSGQTQRLTCSVVLMVLLEAS